MKENKVIIEMPREQEVKQEIHTMNENGFRATGRSAKKKYILIAVSLTLLMLLTLGFSFPNYARQIPIIGGIFELYYQMTGTYTPELQEFAQKVNVTGTVEGMSITIEEAVFDGQNVFFSYLIESDHLLNREAGFDITNLGLIVNGVEIHDYGSWATSTGIPQQVAENEYIVVAMISFCRPLYDITEGVIHFDLGGWNVAFPITRIESRENNHGLSAAYDGLEMEITQVIFTPLGINLHYTYEFPSAYGLGFIDWSLFIDGIATEQVRVTLDFQVLDDLGNEYQITAGAGQFEDSGFRGWVQLGQEGHGTAREVIITPYFTITYYRIGNWSQSYCDGYGIWDDDFVANGGIIERREIVLEPFVIPISE